MGVDDEPLGRELAVDTESISADERLPGFLARPAGEPVYHGFTVLEEVSVDGFGLGLITAMADDDDGDAFVIAPDGSRAGLVWEVGNAATLGEVCAPDENRWGVWAVEVPQPMSSVEAARANLATLVPLLLPKWEAWRSAP